MSGPFRFNQQAAQSPLERAGSPFSAGQQPVSYKTNVNRAKTQKWVTAKKNAYDGDDWGDYDEYDEYGVEESPQPEPAPLSNPRHYGQRPAYDTPSRSFTDPSQQAPLPKARKNSFDAGEEQRSFSASLPHHQQQGYAQQPQYQQPPPLQTGDMGRDIAESSPQSQDFSPSAMPQPLQTRFSTVPTEASNTQFPPRKSSIGQASTPPGPIDFVPIATSPRERTGSQDKSLPFIRPADIYKRVEEERRRESMDSSRPSLDSILSRPKEEPMSPMSPTADRRNLQPLDTVAERKSEYLPDLDVGSTEAQRPQYDRVPSALKGIPTFDNEFWSSGPDLQVPASHAPAVSPSQDQGLRSVVDQAFTRTDDQRSVPPTPISRDSDSDLNRSNTGSTSGISPIMSRVPSSATAALKARNHGDGNTPVIAEEPHEAGTPASRPTSSHLAQAPHAFQGHVRNVSSTSLPRSGLATPTQGDSPARSPAFGPQKTFPEPEAAQIATDSSESPGAMEGGLGGPHSAYATREADIATAMLSSPVRAAPELGAAERQSQDTFLESHNAQSPISDALPRDRSESPNKGRVQALAGKFGEVSSPRRGSTQSNISRNSVQSWERSQDNSRAPSPTKGSPKKPGSPKKEFRPHLPGGWESYAITTPAPVDRSEADSGLGMGRNQGPPALAQVEQPESDRDSGVEKNNASSTLSDIDLTPTTKRRQATEVETPTFDPISALKDAGAVMTESFRTTVGLGSSTEPQQEKQSRWTHGDVYMPRPLHMERTESALSSIPPTPPAKDTPESEFPPTPPLKELPLGHSLEPLARPVRPRMATQLSTAASADDEESDRLRKEIVASLSPLRTSTVPKTELDNNSLRPDSKGGDRASSILDTYYAELDRESPRNSNDLIRDLPELAPLKSASSAHSARPQKPAALERYSWDADSPQVITTEKQNQAAAVPEPVKTAQAEMSSPTIERAVEEEQQEWNEGIPTDSYFGPGHTFTVTKPEPLTDAELAVRATTPPVGSGLALTSPPTREQTRSPGLHIVNSALDPEAVDLPPRWSAEHSPQPPKEMERESSPSEQLKEQQETNPAISAHTVLTGSIEASEPSVVHESQVRSPTSPRSPTSDKPLGAREIATIGSSAERIATYNKTRDQWATTDHGLSDWMTAIFDADPDLATQSVQPVPQARPQSGAFRHKHTGSLAILGKFTGSSNSQPSGGAYDEQHNSAAQSVPASSNSPTAGPSKTGSGFLSRTASHSIQTQQMQAKGKDLLHTAGVLSGKGMTSAKGLFAKGKSRFNRDKDSAHSRDASRELDLVSNPTTTENTTAPTTADGPNESKRRRRFSSPFRRSRSRPRSVSAAFPSRTSLVSTTSLTTTPTEVPDIPKAFQARPHSYHAPDLGMHPAYRGSADQLTPTSPSYKRGRAGVQASPSGIGFVTEREVQGDSVPPVPPLPVGIDNERRGRRSRSWGNASLMLQSAIRFATPPAKSSRSVGTSPIITQFDIPDRAVHESHSIVQPHAPWNDDGNDRTSSPRTRHSSPITQGLWMGDTSPVLSKRRPMVADEFADKEDHQPALPVYTDGTPAPADLVQLSEQPDESKDTRSLGQSKEPNNENTADKPYESLAKSPLYPTEESVPWPGTLLSTTRSNTIEERHVENSGEAPLPQEFVMQFSGDVSPLLRSSKASLQEVSEDESGLSNITTEQVVQRPTWETGVIGDDDVSVKEESATNKEQLRSLQTAVTDKKYEEPGYNVLNEHGAPPEASNPEANPLHTILGDNEDEERNYDTRVVGIGDVSLSGDVSPSSDVADIQMVEKAPVQPLDMQSALESKVIGAGDVSPVSTRSSIFIATSSKGDKVHGQDDEPVEERARPSVERFYTAGVGFDLEPTKARTLGPDRSEDTTEQPRAERFETAQEDVQGLSELTIPKIRRPASRVVTVLASEPVATYKEYTGSSSSSSDDLLKLREPEASSGGALTPQRAERADAAAMPIATRRVSASQLQVVHAVEEYAASNSSLASWDQDSNAADAISEPGATVEMKDESDLVTPVAQVPRNAQPVQQADQARVSNHDFSYAASNGYFNGRSASDSIHQRQQQPAPTSDMTVPERSKSLLSIISSAVSSTPISPASSNAGRSTPSTIYRMQRDFSNAKTSNLTEVQIPEEPTSAKDDQTPTNKHDEYDLYADHNGMVEGVRDESGKPLRVDLTPNVAPAQLARTTTGESSIATVPDTPDSRARRYSFERPMSFIAGPQDDDGRPQDQINQPLASTMSTPPILPQSKRIPQQYRPTPSGAIYSNIAPTQDTHWPPGEETSQPPVQPTQQPVHEPAPAKVVRQPTRFIPHGHENDEDEDSPVQQAANLAPQRTPPSTSTERSIPNGQLPIHGRQQDQREQDSRMGGKPQLQSAPRSVSAPLQQMSIPGQDHRITGQALGSPPAGSATGPRNEFEYQQQMMQLQAKYPRFRGTESQDLNKQQLSPTQQGFQPQEKPSSKPRLAAAIKGIVGRTSPNVPQTSNLSPAPMNMAPTALSTDASRAESFVSAVSNISGDHAASTPGGQTGVIAGPQRPPDLVAESHYSHVSHGSTQMQPAQSRQELTMPAIPAQYQSLHPEQPPQQPQLAPPQSAQSQNYRASTGTIPDSGKKKRFLAFTGLFGKGNAAVELQGKFKLSREEKKAQKAQRHTSQPILQSPPAQQWLPPQAQIIAPQQPVPSHASGQVFPVAGQAVQPVDSRFMHPHGPLHEGPQGSPGMLPSQGLPQQFAQTQMQPQIQQAYPPQQQRPVVRPDEGSAYLRTRQMAEEHQAREAAGQPPQPVFENLNSVGSVPRPSAGQPQHPGHQSSQRPPSNGYYYPEKAQPPPEQGAYRTSLDEHQRAYQLRQQQFEAEQRLHAVSPRSPGEQGACGVSAVSHQQAQQQQRQPFMEAGAYSTTHEERQRMQQSIQYPLPRPEALGRSQIHYDQMQQHGLPQRTNIPLQQERQQVPSHQQQPATTREEHIRQAEQELAQHRWQQQQIQLRQFHMQQQAQLAQQPAATPRSVSGPLLSQASLPASPVAQRHVSSPMAEPEYDTPPIPGAYGHVQGVFVSPLDRQHHAFTTPHSYVDRQEPDTQMQPISPQVSAQSQMPSNVRHHSDASIASVVSPISGPTPEPPTADQRPQNSRMPSISEVHQQQQPERPWHMNFPAGTTEQDIVRARQKQFFQQQFASQQQAQAERHASSPSPRVSPDKQSPPFSAPPHQEQGGGFREVLPRTSPQPYPAPRSAPLDRPSRSPHPTQQAPLRPQEGSGWPLHSSPGSAGPLQPTVSPQPPPIEPQTPRHPSDFGQRRYEPGPPNESRRAPPPDQRPHYADNMPDEAPPSYDGPGVPNDGMEKSNPERPRPPNIVTAPSDRGRQQEGRPRQVSLGLMQHPQPASMAASPQRTAPDMGSESLRRQMLQQEEHARMERIQRSQMQAALRQREQQERNAARARAQELERSVSGGGRVGSLRSVRGSHNGGAPGWERRGLQGESSRPVFELPALEDEEPVMWATSFPGQEWVPPMYDD